MLIIHQLKEEISRGINLNNLQREIFSAKKIVIILPNQEQLYHLFCKLSISNYPAMASTSEVARRNLKLNVGNQEAALLVASVSDRLALSLDEWARLAISSPGNSDVAMKYAGRLSPNAQLPWFERIEFMRPACPVLAALSAIRLTEVGKQEQAFDRLRKSLISDPVSEIGITAWPLVLKEQGQLSGAEKVARLSRTVISRSSELSSIEADIQREKGERHNAVVKLREARQISPRSAGLVMREAWCIPPVLKSTEEAENLRRDSLGLLELYAGTMITRLDDISDPVRSVGTLPFYMAYHGFNERPFLEKSADFLRRHCPDLSFVANHIGKPRTDKKRVGLISQHFRDHSVFHWTEGHLRHLDRSDMDLSILHLNDLTPAIHAFLKEHSNRVVPVPSELRSAQALIGSLQLDVLIFADIGMVPSAYYLAFGRYAPFQIVLPGHPVTSGLDTVDAYLTSRWMEPADYPMH